MNNKLSKSEFHAEFIHDIIEMEYKADALRVLARECAQKANIIKTKGEDICKNAGFLHYDQALEQKSQYDKTAEELYTKALYLEKQADILDKNKNKMYDMNIIPPDYRDLVYLFGFYKIFRNNLADTMREAVQRSNEQCEWYLHHQYWGI